MNSFVKPLFREGSGAYYVNSGMNESFTSVGHTQLRAVGLIRIAELLTVHPYELIGCFRPTPSEVLCMMPLGILTQAKAYESFGPVQQADFDRQEAAFNNGRHVAVTVIYG